MRKYRRVWVVYRKELLETLRDKRTLAAMILVPIVLYPVLMVIIMEALRAETGRRRAEHYIVAVPTEAERAWLRGVLAREDSEPDPTSRPSRDTKPSRGLKNAFAAHLRSDQVDIVVEPPDRLWERVADQTFHAAVLVSPPPDTADAHNAPNRIVQILHSDTNPRSEFVWHQLSLIIANESDRIVRERVAGLPGGTGTLTPLLASNVSTSSPQQQFAKILAMVVPFLLVIMTVTGALYPAIDLTAGERERGTLETLAVSPVPVAQIVAGKFGVIVTIAMFSSTLNLASMTAMIHFSKLGELTSAMGPGGIEAPGVVEQIIERGADDGAEALQRKNLERRRELEADAARKSTFITTAAPIVLLAMLPFSVLAGGVMLATCSFARTFKEAQNYMMPVMMAFIIPAMIVSYMPTTRLEGMLLVLPVANVVVLVRELFLGNYQPGPMAICLLSTCFYAATAMMVAARLYGNEAVLFSDVGSYKTLFKRKFIQARTLPSAAVSLLLVALVFPFYFYWQSYFVDLTSTAAKIHAVLASGQLIWLGLPPIVAAWYLKLNLRETFSLRGAGPRQWLGTALICASIVPVANLLRQVQFKYFPPAIDLLEQQAEVLLEGPPWRILLVLAILPAVCEEILFRGFVLAGLRERMSAWRAALVVGLIFGLFHMYAEKIPVHTLMGMILAMVCLRTGSIFCAMAIHLVNNAVPLLADRIPDLAKWLAMPQTTEEMLRPQLTPLMGAHVLILAVGLFLALRRQSVYGGEPSA